MRTVLGTVLALLLACPSVTWAAEEEAEPGPGLLHRIVLYAPNRVLDLLDLVRLRARVGPGIALDLRVTEGADFFVGSYGALYVGLPGPRGRRLPKLPLGFESRTGVEVSVADLTTGLLVFDPDYSATEVGLGLHAGLVGVDAGIDPMEILDLVAGFFLFDPLGDDL